MASPARPKKSRPGQSASNKAQQHANKKAANAEYKQVTDEPLDLKALVAQIVSAQSSKPGSTNGKRKKLRQTQQKAVAAQDKAEDGALVLSTKVAVLKEQSAKKKTVALREELEEEQEKAHAKPKKRSPKKFDKDPDATTVETKVRERGKDEQKTAADHLQDFEDMLREATDAYQEGGASAVVTILKELNVLAGVTSAALHKMPASGTRKAMLTRFMGLYHRFISLKGETTGVKKWVHRASSLASKVNEEGGIRRALVNAAKLGANHLGKSAKVKLDNVANSVLASLPAPVAAFIVKSTNAIGSGLKLVGKAIKLTGIDTLKWVGKRLYDLSSKVMGLFRSAKNLLGGDGAGDLLAMAAIAMGILPSLVSGLDDELKKQFGDHYIADFISKHWEDTKIAVLDWVFGLVDKLIDAVKKVPGMIADGAKALAHKAVDAIISPEDRKANVDKWHDSTYSSTPAKPVHQQLRSLFTELTAPGATPAQRDAVKIKIQQLVADNPQLAKDQHVINMMQKYGISLKANVSKGAVTSTANVSVPSGATAASGDSASSGNTSVSLPASSGGDTNVTVASPPQPVGDTPVTAPKPAPTAAPPGGTTGSGSSDASSGSQKTSGLSNAAVPNQAVPDTLAFMNMAGMGMT